MTGFGTSVPRDPGAMRNRAWVVGALSSLEAAWPGVLALFVFVLALWAQPDGALVGAFFDDGIYVTLARALAEGEGYRNVHLPGSPPSVHYPFLYPAVLSLLWRLWPDFPANVALFQLLDAAALGGAAWIIAAHCRRWCLPPPVSYVALPLAFSAFPLLTLVGMRFAEPLFLLLWAGAVRVADGERVTGWRAMAAGTLAGLAALTRSVGVAVVGGVVLALCVRRRPREAVLAALTGGLVAAPWFLWTAIHAGEIDPRLAANYGTYVQAVGQAGVESLLPAHYTGALAPLGRLLLPADLPAWLREPATGILALLVVWGAVRVARRAHALVVSLGLYLVMVTLWFWVPDRFIWIVLPWLFLLIGAGALDMWRRGRLFRVVVAVLAVTCLLGYGRREAASLARRGFAETAAGMSAPFTLLAPAIRAETPEDAVIATDREATIWLYAGRRAVPNHLFDWRSRGETAVRPPADAVEFSCDVGVTHLSAAGPGGPGGRVVAWLESRHQGALEPVFRFPAGPRLFRFRCPL